jgi:hypothetical protein
MSDPAKKKLMLLATLACVAALLCTALSDVPGNRITLDGAVYWLLAALILAVVMCWPRSS